MPHWFAQTTWPRFKDLILIFALTFLNLNDKRQTCQPVLQIRRSPAIASITRDTTIKPGPE